LLFNASGVSVAPDQQRSNHNNNNNNNHNNYSYHNNNSYHNTGTSGSTGTGITSGNTSCDKMQELLESGDDDMNDHTTAADSSSVVYNPLTATAGAVTAAAEKEKFVVKLNPKFNKLKNNKPPSTATTSTNNNSNNSNDTSSASETRSRSTKSRHIEPLSPPPAAPAAVTAAVAGSASNQALDRMIHTNNTSAECDSVALDIYISPLPSPLPQQQQNLQPLEKSVVDDDEDAEVEIDMWDDFKS
jgi:hypothetical protein